MKMKKKTGEKKRFHLTSGLESFFVLQGIKRVSLERLPHWDSHRDMWFEDIRTSPVKGRDPNRCDVETTGVYCVEPCYGAPLEKYSFTADDTGSFHIHYQN